MESRKCKSCGEKFEIADHDLEFYGRINVPSPTLCPIDRQKRRLAWRNEWNLYKGKCDKTGKQIISSYPPRNPFPVFEYDEWWKDDWDALDYGLEIDFNKPFFAQFKELLNKVPRMNISTGHNENCDYVNYTNYSKDCYLVFGCHASEKCFFSWRVHHSLGCYDCTQLTKCKYCYECVDCENCYELSFSQNCQNCTDSRYLYNCRSCEDCFLCCDLVHKKNCILNEQYSEEEYDKKLKEFEKFGFDELLKKLENLRLKLPQRALTTINCQNCVGDYLTNCKNCRDTFTALECEDCTYLFLGENTKDCFDCDMTGWPAELCYEGISTCVNAYANYFSSLCWSCHDIYYCDSCFNSHDLFGCIGLKKNEYCILNKQYSKEEYKKMILRLIERMKKTGEYGEFFPLELSPFKYTDSVANDYFQM